LEKKKKKEMKNEEMQYKQERKREVLWLPEGCFCLKPKTLIMKEDSCKESMRSEQDTQYFNSEGGYL